MRILAALLFLLMLVATPAAQDPSEQSASQPAAAEQAEDEPAAVELQLDLALPDAHDERALDAVALENTLIADHGNGVAIDDGGSLQDEIGSFGRRLDGDRPNDTKA